MTWIPWKSLISSLAATLAVGIAASMAGAPRVLLFLMGIVTGQVSFIVALWFWKE